MGGLITALIVLVIFGILYTHGARQNRAGEAFSVPAEITVDYETEFWEKMYREFSCEWEIKDGCLVIDYEIKNPTQSPWYGGLSVTLAAVVLDVNGNHKSVRTATVQDYELRRFLCQGAIRIPRWEVEDGDGICVMVADQ